MVATKIEIKQEFFDLERTRKVLTIVFLSSLSILILMSVCLISSYWITADGFRQGLLYLCIEEQDPNGRSRYDPLPFGLNKDELEPGCYPNRDIGYLKTCTFLCLIIQLSAMATTCLSGLGTRLRDLNRETCLKLATSTTIVTLICDTSLLIIYPTFFAREIEKSNRDLWELNGAYGLACGADILAFGSLILLIFLQKTSNLYKAAPTSI